MLVPRRPYFPHPLALCCHYPVSKCRSASIVVTSTVRVNFCNLCVMKFITLHQEYNVIFSSYVLWNHANDNLKLIFLHCLQGCFVRISKVLFRILLCTPTFSFFILLLSIVYSALSPKSSCLCLMILCLLVLCLRLSILSRLYSTFCTENYFLWNSLYSYIFHNFITFLYVLQLFHLFP